MRKQWKKILLVFAFITIGFIAGSVFVYIRYEKTTILTRDAYPIREGGYHFVNPLLACGISEDKQFDDYNTITDQLKSYIKTHISNEEARNISVYYRELNTGHWSGVNENDVYSPASLMKVPLMIAYLKQADTNPNILKKEITYEETDDKNFMETFKPAFFIKNGNTYTIDQLIRYMVIYSDNNSAELLQNNIDPMVLTKVYSDLSIPVSSSQSDEIISPKIYSYIFRVLYNATYLSKPMSEYALRLLTPADFPDGIKSALPVDLPSSQKFGERTVMHQSQNGQVVESFKELHDCGIVYYPANPYFICVMTKGSDFKTLSKIIGDISSIVYKEISSKK